MNKDIEFFICDCYSYEHQLFFWYNEDTKMFYVYPHLVTHRNFFKRLWKGLKYAFGYSSRFGEWDQFIFKSQDLEKLYKFLETHK